ncbi:trypsin-like serine peptidase [Salininema proteolyticum]|uniref:Trypsin-like serine peptidase n=1 Tax=Salininema proteolyticum TaxID=1607685 RepID=A0ABV8TXJ0_9ACTN
MVHPEPSHGPIRRPARRRRRKITALTAAGAAAAAVAVAVVPDAMADRLDLPFGDSPGEEDFLPVDDAVKSIVDIGERVEVSESLGYDDYEAGKRTLRFAKEGASYVKVHFDRLLLMDGDSLTVSSPDGSESHTYEDTLLDDWAMSVSGDEAVLELSVSENRTSFPGTLGAVVDEVAYGLRDEVVDAAVRDRADGARVPESNCGSTQRRPVPCYESEHPAMVAQAEPVARLLVDGTTLCTAFTVSEKNRLLTNNHCFTQDWEAKRTEVWFGYGCRSCRDETPTDPVKVRGDRVLRTDKSHDYTLFTVDNFRAVRGFGHLELADRRAKRGDQLYIPQHPGGRPKEIAVDPGGSCEVTRARIDGYVEGTDIAYHCDTEFGSSGSPVLSRDSHEVVALHHFGGCPNSGVSADLVRRDIADLL